MSDSENMLDKTEVLLKILELQDDGLTRAAEREQRLFQWLTNLLLAVFGGIVTLAAATGRSPLPSIAKPLITIVVAVPTILSCAWMLRPSSRATKYAETFERIEELLHLFDEGYYGQHSPLPQEWKGNLAKNFGKRTTPKYYVIVLGFVAVCVVIAIWEIL